MLDPIPTLAQLGEAIRTYLAVRQIGLREAEVEFGISRATLSRASRGLNLSAQHFIMIAKKVWPPAN
jgi:uncharacterized protein YerC